MAVTTDVLIDNIEQQFYLEGELSPPEQDKTENSALADLTSFAVEKTVSIADDVGIEDDKIAKSRPHSRFIDEKESNTGYNRTPLSDYLKNIGKYPLLTKEDEKRLSKLVQAGNQIDLGDGAEKRKPTVTEKRTIRQAEQAKEEFTVSNLRLVVSIAKRYKLPAGIDLMDLIQEGNLGLMHAIDLFEWQRGFKFSTYATWWIRQSIVRSLETKASLVRIPADKSASLRTALREASKYRPDQSQFRLNINDEKTHNLANPASIHKQITHDNDDTFEESLASELTSPEDTVLASLLAEEIDALFRDLTEQEQIAVRMHYGFETGRTETYITIGQKLGVTTETARRRAISGLKKIEENIQKMFDYEDAA